MKLLSQVLSDHVQLKQQLITVDGEFWNRPAGIVGNTVWVTVVGGGCSGGMYTNGATGGWGGQFAIDVPVDVGAAQSVRCTVGQGGTSPTLNSPPNPGGTTSFGNFLSVLGGSTVASVGGAPGGQASVGDDNGGFEGRDTHYALAGRLIARGVYRSTGGAGLLLNMPPYQLPNWGARVMTGAQGYGAGGGSIYQNGVGHQAGAPGCILVKWLEAV